jgi:mRNA-degrading endonuclease YafQ of YafQ-DinJ toxin-antitoxin module
MMNVLQKGEFRRAYKKLHDNQLNAVNTAIEIIITDPLEGEVKKGDLAGVQVYKFQVLDQLFLLAYEHDEEGLTLRALGPHENFYKTLPLKTYRLVL